MRLLRIAAAGRRPAARAGLRSPWPSAPGPRPPPPLRAWPRSCAFHAPRAPASAAPSPSNEAAAAAAAIAAAAGRGRTRRIVALIAAVSAAGGVYALQAVSAAAPLADPSDAASPREPVTWRTQAVREMTALQRSARAAVAVATIGTDYAWTFGAPGDLTRWLRAHWRLHLARTDGADAGAGDEAAPHADPVAQLCGALSREDRRACHTRSAHRLLALARKNGGIYIKLGQHVSSMAQILPPEYIRILRPLQDQCPMTPVAQLDAMLAQDTGRSIADWFVEFDPRPIGVASLAQVHRARLRDPPPGLSDPWVAVKLQHPALAEHAPIDIATCARLVFLVEKLFPSFRFGWIAEELATSLPVELAFDREAEHARRAAQLFARDPVLRIPAVVWAGPRVLVMEYISGAGKLDDRAFMARTGIEPAHVARELGRVYAQMIFKDGFVHCDPHAGNILVRPRIGPGQNASWWQRWTAFVQHGFAVVTWPLRALLPNSLTSLIAAATATPTPFDLVLLDHGLYRSLSTPFRLDYARLWASLIAGDRAAIEQRTANLLREWAPGVRGKDGKIHVDDDAHVTRVGAFDLNKLFASMLTGRPWYVIVSDGQPDTAWMPPDGAEVVTHQAEAPPIRGATRLGVARSRSEADIIADKIASGEFVLAVAKVLSQLPPELVLLVKTHDLLRHTDEVLTGDVDVMAPLPPPPSTQQALRAAAAAPAEDAELGGFATELALQMAPQRAAPHAADCPCAGEPAGGPSASIGTAHRLRALARMGWTCGDVVREAEIAELDAARTARVRKGARYASQMGTARKGGAAVMDDADADAPWLPPVWRAGWWRAWANYAVLSVRLAALDMGLGLWEVWETWQWRRQRQRFQRQCTCGLTAARGSPSRIARAAA